MGTEVRIGFAAGLLIVVVAGVYFFYGSSRDEADLKIVTGVSTSDIPKIPAARDDTSRAANPSSAQPAPTSSARNTKPATPTRTAAIPSTRSEPLAGGSKSADATVRTPIATATDSPSSTHSNISRVTPAGPSGSVVTPIPNADANTAFASRRPTGASNSTDSTPLMPESSPPSFLRTSPSSTLIEATRQNLGLPETTKPAPDSSEEESKPVASPSKSEPRDPTTIALPPSLRMTPTDRSAPVRTGAANDRPSQPANTALASNDPRNKPIDARPAANTGASPVRPAVERTTPVVTIPPRVEAWPKTHTIVQNDTVAALSADYYGSTKYIQRILKANPGLDPRRMKIGDDIVIPAPDDVAASALPDTIPARLAVANSPVAATTAPVRTEPRPAAAKTYTVRDGDTFYSIAQRTMGNGAKWKSLFEHNKAVVKNNQRGLKSGMVLAIPGN